MNHNYKTGWVMKIVTAVFVLAVLLSSALAAEKLAPAGSPQGPEIFLQLGHSGWVKSVDMSRDGKYLLSGGWGGAVKLWDVQTGMEIRTLPGHKLNFAPSVALSPDGRHAVSFSLGIDGDIIKLWDLQSGREIYTVTKKGSGTAVSFISNGKYFMISGGTASSSQKSLCVWETATGREVGGLDLKDALVTLGGGTVIVSPDGRFALTQPPREMSVNPFIPTTIKPAKLWNLLTGRVVREHEKEISSNSAFTPDGSRILSYKNDHSLELWDVATGRALWSLKGGHTGYVNFISIADNGAIAVTASKDDGTVRVWDVNTSRTMKVISTPRGFNPSKLSPDGGKILFVDGDGGVITLSKTVKILDALTGHEIKEFKKEGENSFESMTFTPDGGRLLMMSFGRITLWDISTDREVQRFEGSGQTITSVNFAPHRNLAAIVGRKDVALWDVATGERVLVLKGHEQDVSSTAFCPTMETLVTGSLDTTLRFWDLKTGKEKLSVPGHIGGVLSVAYSPDGRLVASAGNDAQVKLWDGSTGALLKTLNGHIQGKGSDTYGAFNGVYDVRFSPDGKTIASAGTDGTVKLWNTATGKEIKSLRGHDGNVTSVAFSPDGRFLVSGGWDGSVRLWDAKLGKELKALKKSGDHVSFVGYSPDGRYVFARGIDEIVRLWSVETGREIKQFAGMSTGLTVVGTMNSAAFSPDSRQLLTNDGAGAVSRIWDISAGKEIAQLISFTDGEWVVITPEGYFNASPGGAKHLNVRVGNNVYSIDNFYEKFFNPVYVASVLQGKKVQAVADIRKGILTPPDVRITSPAPGKEVSQDTLTVTVAARDTGGGIDAIRLYHNGKAIGEDQRGIKLVSKGGETFKDYNVTLVDGVNTFRAVGFSKDRTESNPYELVVNLTAPSKDVSLYVFAVGINNYKNPALNLNYAEPDARGIADFFKGQGKGLFKNLDVTAIYNEQATKQNIVSKLSQMQNINPQDAVLIYLAGHGENINDKWYFIPHELTYPEREEDVKTKGISSDELSGYIKNIKAQKILLLIDACKAGAVLIAFRGFEDRKALSQLSRSTGVHIVAASTKDQFAAEVKELGHGVFTYTLLQGLGGKAAGNGEAVTVRKLMGYVEENLPEITKKYKQEAQYPVVDSRGMDFPLVILK